MSVRGVAVKFGIFAIVMVFFAASLVVVFGEVRFDSTVGYKAEFENSSNIKQGQFVRIAGVEVGKVEKVEVKNGTISEVSFTLDDSLAISDQSRAVIRYANLIGDRYMELIDDQTSSNILPLGSTIPIERTAPALDLDALLGGFRPLFKALDADSVNRITGSIVSVFQGEGGTIAQILAQTGDVTNTLADRDQLIGAVITNLNTVLGTVSDRKDEFRNTVDQLHGLISGLSKSSDGLATAVANISDASGSIAELFAQARPALSENIAEIDRVSTLVNEDQEYLDTLISRLPQDYRVLSRLGLYGDFFSFYLCDVTLKVNGPQGDPVYIDVAGQRAGRCMP